MSDLVSIITPCYNSELYIRETIESVLAQTYGNWEMLIVDDCSSDNSVAIIKDYQNRDNRIKLYQNEINRGAAYSRNFALKKAEGKWIAFLDSDDLWYPEKLQKQIEFMQTNNCHFSYTQYKQIDEKSQDLLKVITGPKTITKRKMFRYCYVGCLTVMYNKEIMGELQVDDEIGNGRNDYALWLKACRKCNCMLYSEILAKYRVRTNSLSHRSLRKLIRYQWDLFRISEKMNKLQAMYYVMLNLFFGFLKKIFYTKKLKNTAELL